jgi:multiple sugar transport system permease protein
VGSIAFQFGIGLALALFFNKRFPLGGLLRSIVLLPWLLPLLVSTTTWRSMMEVDSGIINRGLVNAHLVDQPVPWLVSSSHALLAVLIVNIWIGIPFNMTLLYAGLQEVPHELQEAASLDGAGRFRTFRFITWPLLRPVVAVVLVLGVVYTLKALEIIVVLTRGGPADATQTVATQSYFYSFANLQFGLGAATSNILILLSLGFSIVYLRLNRKSLEA